MVEQLIRNQQVACSSHVSSSMKKPGYPCGSQAFLRSRIILLSVRKAGKEGDKRCPPVQKKAPQKAPPGPVRPRKAGGDASWGSDPQTRRKSQKPKILGLFKACFQFRHILRSTGCYNKSGESQYHSIPVRFTLCVTSGIHEPPESTIIPLRVDSMNVHSIWRCAGSVVWPFRDAERKKLEPSRNLLQR